MIWTHELPTVPGWYWHRFPGREAEYGEPLHVEVHEVYDVGGMLFCCKHPLVIHKPQFNEWAGPIPEPTA